MELIGKILLIIICITLVIQIYFFPTYLAVRRKHPHRWAIFVLNLFFGVTLLGWVGAIIWSLLFHSEKK